MSDAKSKLTAWERWELASFTEAHHADAEIETLAAADEATAAVSPAPTFNAEEIAYLRAAAQREGFATGQQEGFAAGYAEGKAQGEAQAKEHATADAQALASVMAQLETQIAALDQTVAAEIVALATEISREILRQTLRLKPEIIVGVVRDALSHLPLQHATIHLHPDDASLLRSYAGEQLTHAGHRIHDDSKLARGDVLLEAGGSQLDATLAVRWRRVLDSIGQSEPWLIDERGPP